MINTLKITTIAAAALAAVFLLLSVAFGLRTDPEIEKFLKLPGALELYKADSANEAKKANQISPLMKQADAYAKRIQPPQPVRPYRPPDKPPPRPTRVTPKFSLIGTSVYVFNPTLSLALIDEPGKGLSWIRQSDNVGHLVIDQINDGNILVRDGERTETLYVKHPEKQSLLKGTPPGGPRKEFKPTRETKITKPFGPSQLPRPDNSMRQRQRNRSDKKTPRPETLPTRPEPMDIGPEEAKNLEQIGTILNAIEEMENELLRLERERQSIEINSPEDVKNQERIETIQKAMEEMEYELLRLERERQNPEAASIVSEPNRQ
jgi:hypothetical protein